MRWEIPRNERLDSSRRLVTIVRLERAAGTTVFLTLGWLPGWERTFASTASTGGGEIRSELVLLVTELVLTDDRGSGLANTAKLKPKLPTDWKNMTVNASVASH
jgi:hypothetical protein